MNKRVEIIIKSILAGMLIGLAAIMYLTCSDKIVGSILFSIGLISVILLQANLFTGKVGYINKKEDIINLILILIFNLLSIYIIGLIYRSAYGTINIMEIKTNKSLWQSFIDSIGCGILIYLAVELYKKSNNLIPVILCVVGFISAGFEHCIANTFYIAVSDFELTYLLYLLIYIIGNSIGSLLIRVIQKGIKVKE